MIRQPIPKHLAVEMAIEAAIREGVFAAGERLPPDRELARQYGVNPLTLQQAMRRLHENGVVERRQRVGTFARGTTIGANVALLVFNGGHKERGVARQLLQRMQDEGQARAHQVRPVLLMRPYPPLQQLRAELHAMRAGAVGVLDFLNTDRDFIMQLATLWPCVLLNKGLAGTNIPCVTPNMFAAARQVAEYFARRGRRRVAAGVFNMVHQRHIEFSVAFEAECARLGLEAARHLWHETDSFDHAAGQAWLAKLTKLRGTTAPPDALAIFSGTNYGAARQWLTDAKLVCGRDIDVVTFNLKT